MTTLNARRFGAELKSAITAAGITQAAAARAVGLIDSHVSELIRGCHFPTVESAAALAETLDHPPLLAIVLDRRARVCRSCGRSFVDTSRSMTARYCSTTCRRGAVKLQDHERKERGRATAHAKRFHQLRRHQESVAAFCRGCEPEGVCHDGACELRPVSPLPFVALSAINRRRLA